MKLRKKTKKVLIAPKSFTIHRKDWLMDSRNDLPVLLDSQGGMCCLGFFSYACGVGADTLYDRAAPINLINRLQYEGHKTVPKLTKRSSAGSKVCTTHTKLALDAISINDGYMSLKSREEKLTKLFKKHGIEVKFVGKYPKDVVLFDRERHE